MNPRFIDEMSWRMGEVYAAVTDEILVNMARHFKYMTEGNAPSGAWEYQAIKLAEMGQVNQETEAIILKHLGDADGALRYVLEESIRDGLKNAEPALRRAAEKGFTRKASVPELAPNQMQAFRAFYNQSSDKLNLVNTVMLDSTQQAYQATVSDIVGRMGQTQRILNEETGQVITGVTSMNKAVRQGVRRMVDNGITGFIDHGGHHWSPEAYVTMDIRTTMANTAREAVFERQEEYGSELFQVSHHDGARPLCYPWQGKVISRNGWSGEVEDDEGNAVHVTPLEETSYGEPAGLFGINCGHYPIPFFPGFSRIRPPDQDEEANAKEYKESQQQRALERDLRNEKRELAVMKAQGAPEDEIKAQKQRVSNARDNLDSFCDKTGRARRSGREGTPINATFPDGYKQTKYDAKNTQKPTAEPVLKNTSFNFGGKEATITQEGQTIIRDTIMRLEQDYPLPDGYTLDVTDFRTRRGLGYSEDLDDLLDRLETEENDMYFGVKAQFIPLGSDSKRLCIEYIDTTMPNYSPKEQVFDDIHQVQMRNAGGKPFNAGWGYECDTIHEYGHLIAHVYGFYGSEDPEFYAWFESLDKEQIKQEISIYAATNWNEFFAEAFLQSYSPYQSDLSKQAMNYLRKKMAVK